MTGALFIGVNEYNSATDSSITRAFFGLSNVAEKFLEIMGRDPIGMTYPIASESARADRGSRTHERGYRLGHLVCQACWEMTQFGSPNSVYRPS